MEELVPISKEYIEKITKLVNEIAHKPIAPEYIHKLNDDYSLISDIIKIPNEHITNYTKDSNTIYYYSMALPNYTCPFCFDHELDHVPFMMLIEFLRQMAIATSHRLYDIPLHGFTNVINSIDDFKVPKFIELDLPLILVCEDTIVRKRDSVLDRVLTMYLYQNGELCSRASSNITVMTKGIYSKVRKNSRMSVIKDSELPEKPTTNLRMLEKIENSQNLISCLQ